MTSWQERDSCLINTINAGQADMSDRTLRIVCMLYRVVSEGFCHVLSSTNGNKVRSN